MHKFAFSPVRELPTIEPILVDQAKRVVTSVVGKFPISSLWCTRLARREFELFSISPKSWEMRERSGGGAAVDLAMYLAQLDTTDADRRVQNSGR